MGPHGDSRESADRTRLRCRSPCDDLNQPRRHKLSQGGRMLLHQQSGRSHKSNMGPVLQGAQKGVGRHQCLPRSHISLQEPMHRATHSQVIIDAFTHLRLTMSHLPWKMGHPRSHEVPHLFWPRYTNRLACRPANSDPKLGTDQLLPSQPSSGNLHLAQRLRKVKSPPRLLPIWHPFTRRKLLLHLWPASTQIVINRRPHSPLI